MLKRSTNPPEIWRVNDYPSEKRREVDQNCDFPLFSGCFARYRVHAVEMLLYQPRGSNQSPEKMAGYLRGSTIVISPSTIWPVKVAFGPKIL